VGSGEGVGIASGVGVSVGVGVAVAATLGEAAATVAGDSVDACGLAVHAAITSDVAINVSRASRLVLIPVSPRRRSAMRASR
jgi:hypothetical protein